MAVETSARNPSPLVGDKTMRDPGIFTVVYSRAPSPMSLWPQSGGLTLPRDFGTFEKPPPTPRGSETPRLPSISNKPPLPRDLRLVRHDGLTRASSQLDLAKTGKLPEPGKLSTALSNSCPSIKDGGRRPSLVKTGTPTGSPSAIRRVPPRDREATNMNAELPTARYSNINETADGPSSSSASRKRIGTSIRTQETHKSLHKSPSCPTSLNSMKDSKLSSNSSHSTMASNVPKQASSFNSRRLSTVSDRSPLSQRKVLPRRQSPNNGSYTSRTQLTTKTLKSSTKANERLQQQPPSTISEDPTAGQETVDINGARLPVPEGMSKAAFKLCWQWVATVEEARSESSESQTFDLVMDSMIDWDGTDSIPNEQEQNKS